MHGVRGITAHLGVHRLYCVGLIRHFMMEQSNPDDFNVDSLTRTDSLYFTVTVFATVGFGDITATSQAARVVVIAQMILDLLVLGLVVKVFLGAVEKGRGRQKTVQDSES